MKFHGSDDEGAAQHDVQCNCNNARSRWHDMCAFLLACGSRTLGAVWVARADHDSSSGGHRRRPALQLPGDTWWDTAAAQIRAVLAVSACARWYATVIYRG